MRTVAAACVLFAVSFALADSSVPQKSGGAAVLASLERTACYGRCPIYTVTVLRDGTVQWEGKRFVKLAGKASGKLSAATLAALADAFKKADFFALRDKYESFDVTDRASAVVSYDDGKQHKTINHYQGDSSSPEALDVLEKRIDELTGTAKWIGR